MGPQVGMLGRGVGDKSRLDIAWEYMSHGWKSCQDASKHFTHARPSKMSRKPHKKWSLLLEET